MSASHLISFYFLQEANMHFKPFQSSGCFSWHFLPHFFFVFSLSSWEWNFWFQGLDLFGILIQKLIAVQLSGKNKDHRRNCIQEKKKHHILSSADIKYIILTDIEINPQEGSSW